MKDARKLRRGRIWTIATLAMTTLFFGGCALGRLAQLERNLRDFGETSAISGEINHRAADRTRIIAAVFQDKDGTPTLFGATRLMDDNFFILLVPPGESYYVFAFEDRNNDAAYTRGEPVGQCGSDQAEKININQAHKFARCDFKVRNNRKIPELVMAGLAQPLAVKHNQIPLVVGEIADFNDIRFSPEYGQKGMWTPLDFILEAGAGVYFLEPYDPKKIPILFVNGIGGNPLEWKYFFDHIDRKKYQPWFYLYPSGVRLATASKGLNTFIKSLHKRYQFDTLYVTAHSMGGLVARDFIRRNTSKKANNYIKLFVSISTPWRGHESAELGVKYSPATIPCWIDLQTNSDFQKQLFSEPLNPRIHYYLFFSHKGNTDILTGNNDGSVSLASMLRPEAQSDATRTYGFDEDHTSILVSQTVLDTYNKILAGNHAPGVSHEQSKISLTTTLDR